MSTQADLLIELGTEELPVKALPELARALADGVGAGLQRRGLTHGAVRVLYTPRRLAALIADVAIQQPEQRSEVLGPYLNIALDADGQPTRALSGFAAKAGVEWTTLERTSDAKGERFVHRSVSPGAATVHLVPEILAEAVQGMPIPKPMRWGAHDHAFARPLHWLLLLFGDQVVQAQLMGVTANRMSRGHRFHHPKAVWIGKPDDYIEALRAAHVLVDPDERRALIVQQVNEEARGGGGVARIDDGILAEVNCLVEWPQPILCRFEPEFLAVPQEALIATMEANQKFFPVLDGDGRLTEHFVGIANIDSTDVAQIRQGYERVIRPRFADAKFFFEEDLKQGLESMNAGLASVTYQQKLGSVADKVERVAALARLIAGETGVDPDLAERAARLSKADLQSRMVNEFPELQGTAGRYYAAAAGETPELALAIDEGYRPRFADDAIAGSQLGRVLAVAERLDTLAGGFAAGLKPTGNKDPFALRRNALGLARTLIEGGVDVDLQPVLQQAVNLATFATMAAAGRKVLAAAETARSSGVQVNKSQSGGGQTKPDYEIEAELYEFILDRLRNYYAEQSLTPDQFEAVAVTRPSSLIDFDRRLKAIAAFAALPEAAALAAANKRIGNILKKHEGELPAAVDPALLVEPAEHALHLAVEDAVVATDPLLAAHDYIGVLSRLAALREPVDAFFDSVMVMADDPAVRNNRLALLNRLSARFLAIADIAQLNSQAA